MQHVPQFLWTNAQVSVMNSWLDGLQRVKEALVGLSESAAPGFDASLKRKEKGRCGVITSLVSPPPCNYLHMFFFSFN